MKKNLLYHRVQPRLVQQVLESQSIKQHTLLNPKCICMTRNVILMSRSRPFVVVFDRDILKQHYKVKPFCLLGWKFISNSTEYDRWKKRGYIFGFENEERVYGGDIPLSLAEYVGELPLGHFDYTNKERLYKIWS